MVVVEAQLRPLALLAPSPASEERKRERQRERGDGRAKIGGYENKYGENE